jgi:hypothetical protein
MINTLFLWATIIILALLIELGTPGLFYFLSLAIGSAAAAFLSYAPADTTGRLFSGKLPNIADIALSGST